MDNVSFAYLVIFSIFNILLPSVTCIKVSKIQANLMDHASPKVVQRNSSLRRQIVSSGTKSCTESNDTGENIAQIKQISVKLLEKVIELEKSNNMTLSTNAMPLSSALTKEHTHPPSSVTCTLPVSLPSTSTTAISTTTKSVPTSSPARAENIFPVTTLLASANSAAKTDKPKSLTTIGGTTQMSCTSLPQEYEKETPLRTTESAAGKKRDGIRERMWGPWTAWSCCSVTCGKGRQVRWRHCIADKCPVADAEMEEKICQKPPCSSSKFLGLF